MRKKFKIEGNPEHGEIYELDDLLLEYVEEEDYISDSLHFNGEHDEWRVL